MFFLLFLFLFNVELFADSNFNVSKESYLTFDAYMTSQQTDESFIIRAPSDWIKLKFKAPLIAKYDVNSQATLSISVFEGTIGDDLSNINRWRSQLGLIALKKIPDSFKSYSVNGIATKSIHLSNNYQFFSIYWLTVGDKHVFNKFVSVSPLSKSLMNTFIEGQAWQNI